MGIGMGIAMDIGCDGQGEIKTCAARRILASPQAAAM
jgi:hypothetical protein